MTQRFENLTKIPQVAAARMLSDANVHLSAPVGSPVTAPGTVVLQELADQDRVVDILMLLAVLLPQRERVWWACMAARDYIGPEPKGTPSLRAAEAWVFKPTPENRVAAQASLDHARVNDDTTHCAVAVLYADGTLGPGDMAEHPAPAGAAEMSVFAMNMVSLGEHADKFAEYAEQLIDRAVDIARGGNGRVAEKAVQDKQTEGT